MACGDGRADWLLSEALPGIMAADPCLRADPATLVPILARALRRFHDTPAAQCPFPFPAADALARVRWRVAAKQVRVADMHDQPQPLSPAGALAELERLHPDREDLVVCHGDYCLPNVPGRAPNRILPAAERLCGVNPLAKRRVTVEQPLHDPRGVFFGEVLRAKTAQG